jgi:hypothetical protein
MTLHVHKVDDSTDIKDCTKPMHVPPGWQIADGSAHDIRVCTAHPWQTYNLIFADGLHCGTANHPYTHCRGTHPQPSYRFLIFASHLKIEKQGSASNNFIKQDAQGAIALRLDGYDVLLRRRV